MMKGDINAIYKICYYRILRVFAYYFYINKTSISAKSYFAKWKVDVSELRLWIRDHVSARNLILTWWLCLDAFHGMCASGVHFLHEIC